MKKIIIASENPVKIEATKNGFKKMFPDQDFDFTGVSVDSLVSDQPMTDSETYIGASNRVKSAIQNYPKADYYIGIEGGLERTKNEMHAFAWVVIKKGDTIGKSKTATFYLPRIIMELINQGKELGEADDIVFGLENSKQQNGAVGILTKNVLTRESYYTEAVILALIPFLNDKLY